MNIGAPEVILVVVFGLLIFGPKRLPDIARSLGRAVREFRRATDELKSELRLDLNDEPSRAPAAPPAESREPRPGPRL
ncbi:MAG: twin-arginine translocase TatA/TatE family subunit [Actinomycetota bacterium]